MSAYLAPSSHVNKKVGLKHKMGDEPPPAKGERTV